MKQAGVMMMSYYITARSKYIPVGIYIEISII